LSFAPDSPFFSSRLHQAGSDLDRLGDFLKVMVRLIRQFCKDTKQCAKSAEGLGLHMCHGLGGSESHVQLLPVIKRFGDIFTEIASSQEILAESLERTFAQPLEQFYTRDLASVHTMRQQYTNLRDTGESAIMKYLQSDVANFGRGVNQNQLEQRAYEIVQHKKRFETVRFDLVNKVNEIEARKSFELAESCVSGVYALRTHFRLCMDRVQSCEAFMEDLQMRQQRERAEFQEALKPLERRRRDVMTVLDAMVERVEIACPHLYPTDPGSGDRSPSPSVADDFPISVSSPPPSAMSSTAASFQSLSRMGASWGANLIGGLTRERSPSARTTSVDGQATSHTGRLSVGADGGRRRATMLGGQSYGTAEEGGRDSMSAAGQGANPSVFAGSCEDCEVRMKALDNSELMQLYTLNAEEEPAGVVRQGYLWKRNEKQKLIEHWKRRWFVLDETKLYHLVEEGNTDGKYHVQTVCDLMLASVRELKCDSDMPFCFEIAFANVESTMVQAEGQKEYHLWITDLRNTIEKRLVSGDHVPVMSSKKHPTQVGIDVFQRSNSRTSSNTAEVLPGPTAAPGTPVSVRRARHAPTIAEIRSKNPQCAECGREAPEWASLNLGCLVCIDCSGVHRAMGVHISKMRSLNLDDLDPEQYAALCAVGNDCCNSVWEANVPPDWKRLSRMSNYTDRERFIRAKYERKSFLDPLDGDPTMGMDDETLRKWSDALVEACQKDDVTGLIRALARGATACFVPAEVVLHPDIKRMPLHVAAAHGSHICVVLLVENGADVIERDEEGRNPAEIAEQHDHRDIALFLRRRMELIRNAPSAVIRASIPNRPSMSAQDTNTLPSSPSSMDGSTADVQRELRGMVVEALSSDESCEARKSSKTPSKKQ